MKDKVRVSMGTLRVLGLEMLETDADPNTAYLQTYEPGRCSSNCSFCSQARLSKSSDENIARGLYPPRDVNEIVPRLAKAHEKGLLKRACIQTMNYPGMFTDLICLIEQIRKKSSIPISISVFPLPGEKFRELRKAGANQIVIPLDAVTKDIFGKVKGARAGCPYAWETHLKALSDAVRVFGKGNVGTHLIIGLGETEEESSGTIQMLYYMGVYPALFAYTPVHGSQLKASPPEIGHYRRIQAACHIIAESLATYSRMEFCEGKITGFGILPEYLAELISSGLPFMTRGCSDCNRPYSTERPGGIIYNYPRELTDDETELVKKQMTEGL